MKPTDVNDFISNLHAGSFEKKLAAAISMVAASVTDDEKGQQGEISITLSFSRIGASSQVKIKHKLVHVRPTLRGKVREEDTTETPMYVCEGVQVHLFPPNQNQLFPTHSED